MRRDRAWKIPFEVKTSFSAEFRASCVSKERKKIDALFPGNLEPPPPSSHDKAKMQARLQMCDRDGFFSNWKFRKNLEIHELVRSLKSSNFELDRYFDGRLSKCRLSTVVGPIWLLPLCWYRGSNREFRLRVCTEPVVATTLGTGLAEDV